MDLNDLKKTWDNLASDKELNEEQFKKMLSSRTKNLIERIERNIRAGFYVLFALILLYFLNDFIVSPLLVENLQVEVELPLWLQIFSVFGDLIIVVTFLFFVFRYNRVKKWCDKICDLKNTLIKIISTLNLYRTLYYISIFTILFSISVNFIAGMYEGVLLNAHLQGIEAGDFKITLTSTVILIFVIFLVFTFTTFLLFRWGFRRLYGNYITQLKTTLKELEENEEINE